MDRHSEQYRRLVHQLADINDRYQQIQLDYSKELRDYGTGELYTPAEVHMVTRIEENPGITATKIAEDTFRTKSAVSQMLSKLEAKGLICREKDPNNGKQFFLYATPKGKHLSLCHKAYDEAVLPLDDIVEQFGIQAVEQYVAIVEYYLDRYAK